jgi:hypothetical protein
MTDTLESLIKEFDEDFEGGRTLERRETGKPVRTIWNLTARIVEAVRPQPEPELILMYATELSFLGDDWWSTAGEFNDPEIDWEVVTVCPHCGAIHRDGDEEAILELDRSERANSASLWVEADDAVGFHVSSGDDFYETFGFACGTCEKRITLPESTETSWD